jgi:hypothetical protein
VSVNNHLAGPGIQRSKHGTSPVEPGVGDDQPP